MRILILVFIVGIISCKSQETIISKFSRDLFDSQVNPEKLVENYIAFDTLNSDSNYTQRKSAVIEHIKAIRQGRNIDQGWIMPKGDWDPDKIKIKPYKQVSHLGSLKLNAIENNENRVFVITDPDQKKILQYFLLDEKNKIHSFSLLVKGDQAWFFIY